MLSCIISALPNKKTDPLPLIVPVDSVVCCITHMLAFAPTLSVPFPATLRLCVEQLAVAATASVASPLMDRALNAESRGAITDPAPSTLIRATCAMSRAGTKEPPDIVNVPSPKNCAAESDMKVVCRASEAKLSSPPAVMLNSHV